MFYDARPPGIYKPDYIDALYTFYHEIKPESVTCPPTPEWKRSTELDLNGEVVQDDDDDGDDAPAVPVQVSLVQIFKCQSRFSSVADLPFSSCFVVSGEHSGECDHVK